MLMLARFWSQRDVISRILESLSTVIFITPCSQHNNNVLQWFKALYSNKHAPSSLLLWNRIIQCQCWTSDEGEWICSLNTRTLPNSWCWEFYEIIYWINTVKYLGKKLDGVPKGAMILHFMYYPRVVKIFLSTGKSALSTYYFGKTR